MSKVSVLERPAAEASVEELAKVLSLVADLTGLALQLEDGQRLTKADQWAFVHEVAWAACGWLGGSAAELPEPFEGLLGRDLVAALRLLAFSAARQAGKNLIVRDERGLPLANEPTLSARQLELLSESLAASASTLRRGAWFEQIFPPDQSLCRGGPGFLPGLERV